MSHKTLELTRSDLVDMVTSMLTSDVLAHDEIPDVKRSHWIELFYIVLSHSTSYIDGVKLSIPGETYGSFQDFTARLKRVCDLMVFVHKRPPIRQHSTLIKALINVLNGNAALFRHNGATAAIPIQMALQDYLAELSPVVIKATKSKASLQKYLGQQGRFYLSPSDPEYDEDDFDFQEYKDYLNNLKHLASIMNGNRLSSEVVTYLFLSDPYTSMTHEIHEIKIPIIANIFPPEQKHFATDAADMYWPVNPEIFHPGTIPSFLNVSPTLPENQFSSIINDQEFEALPAVDKTVPGTPFPEGFFDNPDGLPNKPSGKGKRKETETEAPPTSEQEGEGSTSGQPPSGPPPPPAPNPSIPDDTGYEPTGMLARKARSMTEKVRAQDAADMSHDHMDRFGVTTEGSMTLSSSQVRRGPNADFTITVMTPDDRRRYVVTYTRMSRKPIFNPIA